MAAQTEFERGFLAGVNAMRIQAANQGLTAILNIFIPIPKQEREE